MKRFLRKFFLILFISLIVLFGLSLALTSLFEKQIGDRIISLLNQQLTTELTVGDMDLTALRTFPYLAANLRDVRLDDTYGDALIEAHTLSFRFGLLSVLSSNYEVKSVKVSKGLLAIHVDQRGVNNYEVYRTPDQPGNSNTSDTGIKLEEAILEDVDLTYDNRQTGQRVNLLVDQATFSGAFSSRQFTLKSDAKLLSKGIQVGDTRYLVRERIGYQAALQVDLTEGIYRLEQVEVDIDGNAFAISGVTENWEEGLYYDLLVNNEEGSIEGVLQLLPENLSRALGDFRSRGSFTFQATIKGPATRSQSPEIRADLSLDQGRLIHPSMPSDFKDVSFKASFQNGKDRNNETTVLAIRDFTGYFNRQLTEMQLEVQNLDDPRIDFSLNGAVPMGAVYGLLGSPSITDGSGELELQNLRVRGRYEDMIRTSRISRVQSSGRLEFDDASLTINDEQMVFDRGTLDLNGNQLAVNGLKLIGANSDMELEGTAFNIIPVLFADSTNSQRASLEFQANLTGDQIDISKLLTVFSLKVAEQDTLNAQIAQVDSIKTATVQKQQRLINLLKGRFETNVKQFYYQDIEGRDFSGQLDFSTNQIAVKGSTNTMRGQIDLDGRLFFLRQPSLEATLIGEGLDINTFFQQTNNLGQQVLTSDNISGTLTTKTKIFAFWDNRGNFQPGQMRILSAIAIEDGRLSDFGLMENFSTFVNINDLKNIQFTRIENYLEIADNRIYLPAMFIQSNAMNLTVSGEHDFSNTFEYNIQVNAGQVLTNRFKKHDPKLSPIKAKQKGFFNLYYRVYGDLDDYEFESSKRRVEADFARSQYRKREIQRALVAEFGPIDLVQEPATWVDEGGETDTEFLEFEVEGQDTTRRNQ